MSARGGKKKRKKIVTPFFRSSTSFPLPLPKKQLGGGARHLRQYMATKDEDAAPPKGQGEGRREGKMVNEGGEREGCVFFFLRFDGLLEFVLFFFRFSHSPSSSTSTSTSTSSKLRKKSHPH